MKFQQAHAACARRLALIAGATCISCLLEPGLAQIQVTPAPTTPFPREATTVPFPGQANTIAVPSSSGNPSGNQGDANCDYACQSRRYQLEYMRQQCLASGNRQYYCNQQPLTDAQRDAINRQSEVMRGQYGYYRNGIFYSNP